MPLAPYKTRYKPFAYAPPGSLTPFDDADPLAFNPRLGSGLEEDDGPQQFPPEPPPPDEPEVAPKPKAAMPPPVAATPRTMAAPGSSMSEDGAAPSEQEAPATRAKPVEVEKEEPAPSRRDAALAKTQELSTPTEKHSNWAQRLGLAMLSMTKLAPYANQLLHPKWSEQEEARRGKLGAAEQELKDIEGVEKNQADTAEMAARGKLYGQQADTMAAEGKMRPVVSKDGTVIDPRTGQPMYSPVRPIADRIKEYVEAGYAPDEARILAAGGKGSDLTAKPVKTLEHRAIEILEDANLTPEQKQQQLDAVGKAHNLLHPTAPIHGFETDGKGNTTLIVADPANPQAAQKIPLGAVGKPQQAPASIQLGNMMAGNKDAIDVAATQYEQTRTMPPIGRNPAMAVAILKRVAERQKAAGISPEQSGVQAELFKANRTALSDITKREAQIGTMEKTAGKNLDVFLQQAKGVTDSGIVPLNHIFRGGAKAFGDPKMAGFEAARITAFTEISRVLSGSMGGQLSDTARKEAESILKGDYTLPQLVRAAQILRTDMKNRMQGIADEKQRLSEAMGGGAPQQHQTDAPTVVKWTRDAHGNPVPGK
jgi:hypothetical protein